jgi:hypothetical protein
VYLSRGYLLTLLIVENSKQKSHAMVLRRLSILQWSKAYTYTCPNGPYYHWKPMFSWMPLHSWIATSSLRHQFPTLILLMSSLSRVWVGPTTLLYSTHLTHCPRTFGQRAHCWTSPVRSMYSHGVSAFAVDGIEPLDSRWQWCFSVIFPAPGIPGQNNICLPISSHTLNSANRSPAPNHA